MVVKLEARTVKRGIFLGVMTGMCEVLGFDLMNSFLYNSKPLVRSIGLQETVSGVIGALSIILGVRDVLRSLIWALLL